MLTSEDRLAVGLKVLDRLTPLLKAHRRAEEPPTVSPVVPLQSLLADCNDLAGPAVALGACEDGQPLLLELDNAAPGSILILGDRGSGKTRLLRAMLTSLVMLNTPQTAGFHLIGGAAEDYAQVSGAPHALSWYAPDDATLGDLLVYLNDEVESRRTSPARVSQEPALVLGLDGLAQPLQSLERDGLHSLSRLIRHGPRCRVWTVATLESEAWDALNPAIAAAFRTRVLGRIRSRKLAQAAAGSRALAGPSLAAEGQFFAPDGEAWLPFWVCDPQMQTFDSISPWE
jgi:hypothetical protein